MNGASLTPSQSWLLKALEKLESILSSEYQPKVPPALETTGDKHISLVTLTKIQKTVHQKVKRDTIQIELVSLKGGRCERCGDNKHPNIYDFHHRCPSNKSFNLDKSNYTRT